MLTHLSTFSGIEGIGLVAELEGFQTIGHCDIEPFAREVIRHHWSDTPIWWDIRHMNRRRLIKKLVKQGVLTRDPRFGSLVDLLSGGFPCQPFSLAGERRGEFDERHLFPELARFIREVRPRWVLLENVPGLFSANAGRVFRDVLGALAAMGYRVGWCCYGAGEVGAPHRRERVFIIGYLADPTSGQRRAGAQVEGILRTLPSDEREQYHLDGSGAAQSGEGVADADAGLSGDARQTLRTGRHAADDSCANARDSFRPTQSRLGGTPDGLSHRMDLDSWPGWPAGPGQEQNSWEPPRVAQGIKDRVARLKALGNAVVPQQVRPILRAIKEAQQAIASR